VVLIGREVDVGMLDLKGDLETRFVLLSLLKVFEERRAIWEGCTCCGCCCWESRFAILSGEVGVAAAMDGGEDELQPSPDSRRMEDLTGSFTSGGVVGVRRRSRRGVSWRGLGVVIDDGDDECG